MIVDFVFDSKIKAVKLLKKEIKKVIDSHVQYLVEDHFQSETEGGWDIDKEFITSDILYDLLGFHISQEINYACHKKGLVTKYEDGKVLICDRNGYFPIFVNKINGKIKVADTEKQRDILFKDKQWEHIGRL